jgi:hypothetical protein
MSRLALDLSTSTVTRRLAQVVQADRASAPREGDGEAVTDRNVNMNANGRSGVVPVARLA